MTARIFSQIMLVSPDCFTGRMKLAWPSPLLGRFCYASNFVHTPHIALNSQQGERSEGVRCLCLLCIGSAVLLSPFPLA